MTWGDTTGNQSGPEDANVPTPGAGSSERLLPGDPRQLGAFYLDGRLGAGGQGVVYEAYGPDGTRVAVKALHGVGDADRENLRREIRAWRRVAPFCTAKVLHDELDNSVPFVVSEYVAGSDLRRAVESGVPYGPEELRRLAIGVATALVAIHRAGVVHRDLKPENILLAPDGPRVIDFGIARVLEGSASAGLPMGTLRYMAPERYRGAPGDGAVDVWGWGAVILFAATGRHAFDGANPAVLARRVADHHPDTSRLEEPLRSLVAAALSKDPAGRPTSQELLLSLAGGDDLLAAVKSAALGARREPAEPSRAEVAEAVFTGLDPEAQEAVSAVLLRLVAPGERAEDTLRSARRPEFADDRTPESAVDRVLEAFARAGIVVWDGDAVALSSAALIRAWPRLRAWVDAERDGLGVHLRLAEDSRAWDRHGRKNADLLHGTALDRARDWAATGRRHLALNRTERDYLDAGARHVRRLSRRRALLGAFLAVLVVVALLLAALFTATREEARDRRAAADSRALAQAAQDTTGLDPVQAAMLAMAGYQTSPTKEARNQMLRQYIDLFGNTRVLSGLLGTIADFDMSRDGDVVIARTTQGRTTLFTGALSDRVRTRPIDLGYVTHTVVSPDGRRAAFVTVDGDAGWFPVDPSAADPAGAVRRLPPLPGLTPDDGDGPDAVDISQDGTRVAAQVGERVVWWDLDAGTLAGSWTAPERIPSFSGVRFGPDRGTLLLRTVDGTKVGVAAVDVAMGVTRTVVEPVNQDVVLSGDRTAAALCRLEDTGDGDRRSVFVLRRVADGAEQGRPYRRSDGCHLRGADTTGRHILVEEPLHKMAIVDTDQGTLLTRHPTADDYTPAVQLVSAADGRLLLAGHTGSRIEYSEVPEHEGILDSRDQIILGDGSRTVTLLTDGSLQVRTVDDSRLVAQAPGPGAAWSGSDPLRVNREHTLVAVREGPNVVVVRDTTDLRTTARLTTAMPPDASRDAVDYSYSFDRTSRLVTVSGTLVQQWDTGTGALLASFDVGTLLPRDRAREPVWSAGPHTGEDQISVVIHGDPAIRIVDLATGRTAMSVDTGVTDAISVQFDPSGRYFALLRQGAVLELWRRDPLRKELGPLPGIAPTATSTWIAQFIDDEGHYMVGANDAVRIYEVGRQTYTDSYDFGMPDNSTDQDPFSFVSASKDGGVLSYSAPNGMGATLVLDPDAWHDDLCGIIGNRSFTADERDSLPVRIPTQPICPHPHASPTPSATAGHGTPAKAAAPGATPGRTARTRRRAITYRSA
ncbi:protein kinase [Yinghuangia sp. ASG 101]|uniref:protein kinase domain-containing protein n=1 Tax=Yinghuangia sp. ASG 101 TaxID=2896848 RepID=UPI001E341970|nr:protein kinase [Yinghuangia sp. ASG 101]UGQ11775.1 protein kinase [Yinghuangia sp. ASG 101]